MDTLYIGEGYILSLWISVTIHLIGYIYMMQMFYSIFDFVSDFRPHFQPETAQRFINSNKIEYFVHRRRLNFVIVNLCYHSLNWIYLYDADVFFQFSIFIRILNLISDPNQSRDSFIVRKLDTLYIGEGYILSLWICVTIHLIGYIYMMQRFSFNFRFWFGF